AQVRAGGVDAEHHVEAVRLLVDRQEARVPEEVAAVGREHGAHQPELGHRAAQLARGRVGILHGQERDRVQARALLDELLVQERVVGAAQRGRPLAVLEKGEEEPEGGIEYRLLHAPHVERAQPGVRGSRAVAERAEEPPVPAVPRVEREVERPPVEGRVEILRDLLDGLGDVAVGVEDGIRGLAHEVLQRGIASGFTQWAGTSPRPASLWLTLWGVRMSFSGSTSRSGLAGASGSRVKASSAAPAIQPSLSARAIASSSAISPRAVLIRIAVGFMARSAFSPIRLR